MMDGTVRTVDLEGGRVLRCGRYLLDDGDEEPAVRIFVSTGWASVPLTPFARETVDVPADRLPELVAALEGLEGAS